MVPNMYLTKCYKNIVEEGCCRVQREAAVCISWMAGAKVEANLKGKKAQVKDITIDSRTTHAPASAGLKARQIEGGGEVESVIN